jgi:ActR/RegA family two-component response regulator
MPDGDGLFLIRQLGDEIGRGMKFAFITGFSDLTRREALKLGASELFQKPFDLSIIRDFLRDHV